MHEKTMRRRTNQGWYLGSWLWFGLLSVCISAQTSGQPAPSAAHRVIPWLEINEPSMPLKQLGDQIPKDRAEMTLLEHGMEGILLWSRVTDTIIITTRPGKSKLLYAELARRKPTSVRIIGGLKTYTLPVGFRGDKRPYDFADEEGWRSLAAEAAEIALTTGSREVLMENESSLLPVHTGKATVNLDRLGKSLAALRRDDLQILWWTPFMMGNIREVPSRDASTKQLVLTAATSVPGSVFLVPYAGWHGWERKPDEVQRRELMMETVGRDRVRDLVYLETIEAARTILPPKRRRHTAPEVLRDVHALTNEVILYPGAVNWVTVAREYVEHATRVQDRSP